MYTQIELEMLNLGDADCILLSAVINGYTERVLIDGGNTGDTNIVAAFLLSRGIRHIDHLVATHTHDDHVGGLVRLVQDRRFTFGTAWLHLPWDHIDIRTVLLVLKSGDGQDIKIAKKFLSGLQTTYALTKEIERRGDIAIAQPFQDDAIGPLIVCSPTIEFYRTKLCEFADLDRVKEINATHLRYSLQESVSIASGRTEEEVYGLMENPVADPENEASIVTSFSCNGRVGLLTADAGVDALGLAIQKHGLERIDFMQIPHHGSRRNITERLIQHFAPRIAFVSAAGNGKHPRRSVVYAFQRAGTAAYSTHWPKPGGNKWQGFGNAAMPSFYKPASKLYDE